MSDTENDRDLTHEESGVADPRGETESGPAPGQESADTPDDAGADPHETEASDDTESG